MGQAIFYTSYIYSIEVIQLKYYIRFPSKDNMNIFYKNSAQFESTLILEAIKQMDLSNAEKKKIVEHSLEHLKSNPR